MAQPREKKLTPDAYFEMEETSEYKSDYYAGELFAMTGASVNHSLVVSNVLTAFNNALRNSDCYVFPSDMKVELERAQHYVYPDISVVCGGIKYAANRNDVISNPVVIIEILSESTKDYDRGTKFQAYRKVFSLRDYILIDQDMVHVEYFYKNESGFWTLEEFDNPNDCLSVKSIHTELSLKDIYYRIEFTESN